jgi:hypothetical protein
LTLPNYPGNIPCPVLSVLSTGRGIEGKEHKFPVKNKNVVTGTFFHHNSRYGFFLICMRGYLRLNAQDDYHFKKSRLAIDYYPIYEYSSHYKMQPLLRQYIIPA